MLGEQEILLAAVRSLPYGNVLPSKTYLWNLRVFLVAHLLFIAASRQPVLRVRPQLGINCASTQLSMAERQGEPIKADPEETGSITGESDGNTSDDQVLVSDKSNIIILSWSRYTNSIFLEKPRL